MPKSEFWRLVDRFARVHPRGAPPIPVVHPSYGLLGHTNHGRGFRPLRGRWASTYAIQRDHSRAAIRALRTFEDYAPRAGMFLAGLLAAQPQLLNFALGAISNYDGIVTARGSGALQDVWMNMTATQTPVTTSWYDLQNFASWQPSTAPSITSYANGGTGGAVLDATSNGSWLTNPGGSNKKYIVGCGLSVTSITGFALAMLIDVLWAGSFSLTSAAPTTINPTSDITVTRYASTTPGNADYAGGNMLQFCISTTTATSGPPSLTTTYVDQGGTGSKTTISTLPAAGIAQQRVICNTTHNTSTVITSTPFAPLTNSASTGVRSLEQIVVGGTAYGTGAAHAKIVRPLLIMPFIAANSWIEQDATLNIGNLIELRNVSQVCGCLSWNTFSGGTTAASMAAFLRMVEG